MQIYLYFQSGKLRGPMDGHIFAVKDNFCVKGSPTTCASNMLKNFAPTYDATVVKKTKWECQVVAAVVVRVNWHQNQRGIWDILFLFPCWTKELLLSNFNSFFSLRKE